MSLINKTFFSKSIYSSPDKQTLVDPRAKSYKEIQKKYIWLNDNTTYGQSFHAQGEGYINFIKTLKVESVLDIGTGKGHFCQWAKQNLCDTVYGLDFAIQPDEKITGINFINAPSHEIPLPDKSIDLVTSFDVMEHLHPDYLEKTISEMFRVAKSFLFHSISSRPSYSHINKVGQLHLIQQPMQFWLEEVFLKMSPNSRQHDDNSIFVPLN
jgi:2-polyprenyl-3-methyl-5-hydroxy-6-metoxy-1,4-benzoquinol methylase